MGRRIDLDVIKGMAITVVILYHVGVLPFGFLGVETFMVITGFLIIPPLTDAIQDARFSISGWLTRRLIRLWPLTLAAGTVALLTGYHTMIPYNYENLAQSVVASNLFMNNILGAVTTRNYWDVVNEFKPLMHLWYLGVVVQSYLILSILFIGLRRLHKPPEQLRKIMTLAITALTAISFAVYCWPGFRFSDKFYLVQFRFWEFGAGGLAGIFLAGRHITMPKWTSVMLYVTLCLLFCSGWRSLSEIDTMTVIDASAPSSFLDKEIMTIAAALTSALLLATAIPWEKTIFGKLPALTGRMSLSLFVWHQIFIAFIRDSVSDDISIGLLMTFLLITAAAGWLSFRYVEKIRLRSTSHKIVFFTLLSIVTLTAFGIHLHAGVVRDVPELGVTYGDPYANRNTEYTDRIWGLTAPFSSDKLHVLVAGNSFARDFACILLEYDNGDKLEISYTPHISCTDGERLRQADFIFSFGSREDFSPEIQRHISPDCKLYGISTKCFGKNFDIFYAKRGTQDYFAQSIPSHPICDSINNVWRESWGDTAFIDLMDAARLPDGRIRIFTPDKMAISFDCRHLTQARCRFYAARLPLDSIFGLEDGEKFGDVMPFD